MVECTFIPYLVSRNKEIRPIKMSNSHQDNIPRQSSAQWQIYSTFLPTFLSHVFISNSQMDGNKLERDWKCLKLHFSDDNGCYFSQIPGRSSSMINWKGFNFIQLSVMVSLPSVAAKLWRHSFLLRQSFQHNAISWICWKINL